MKSTDIIQPKAISNPIAYNGTKNSIPENPSGTQLASVNEGFPYITQVKIENGGLPPERADFNGLFYLSTDQRVFQQNGGIITFKSEVSNAIGGYPQGAILDYLDSGYLKKVISLVEDNTTNFIDNGIDNVNWQLLPAEDSTKVLIDGSNATFSNLSNTAKDNISSFIGLKKINEFNIEDGDTEVEITGIGQKETIIDIDGLYANTNPCTLDSLLGNSGSYYNTNYFVSIMIKDNNTPTNWLSNSYGTTNTVNTLTNLKYNDWSLNSTYPTKLHLEISKVIGNTIYVNGNCQLITTNGNYIINNIINNALVQNDLNVDRIKIYLSGSTFKAGNVRIYEKL